MTELLSPAGDLEKLRYAVRYGANSVYLAGKSFGMRSNAGNFEEDEMIEGINFAHEHNVNVFVTVNIAARNSDLRQIESYVKRLSELDCDGLIIADPGVIRIVKQAVPDMYISLSTQANTTNVESVRFWHEAGVNRIVLARELSFKEIEEICRYRPEGMHIETFIHGAMCISYSGRCLLSNYFTHRDANRGDCAQPCRWAYRIQEINRENEWCDIEQDENGTYILNSKDLCLIDKVPELIACGVDSFKIEGRMKTYYYTAAVTNAYRRAIDRYNSGAAYRCDDLYEDLQKVSHRAYTGAYYDGKDSICQNYEDGGYIRSYSFIAEVTSDTDENGLCRATQKNKFYSGDEVEVLSPDGKNVTTKITAVFDADMNPVDSAPHPNQELVLKTDKPLNKFSLIRKKAII